MLDETTPPASPAALASNRVVPSGIYPARSMEAIATQTKRQAVNDLVAGAAACPGCSRKISRFEVGTIDGPLDTRWHKTCLRCGTGGNKTGCGKPVDASATFTDEGIWCRLCFVGFLQYDNS